ncbi:ATP-binding protein [bacterium]|nr:ATP-binding protein [bacterium]
MIPRKVSLPEKSSFFLFGPRQTGKSTLIDSRYVSRVWKIDLLLSESFLTYSKDPGLFRREAVQKLKSEQINTIFVDEIQRIPGLLNEVQFIMGQYPNCRFILTGSSARKLRRGGVNLLAGRAAQRRLFPFVYEEIPENFDLDDVLLFGTLPPLYKLGQEEKRDILEAYVHTYLQTEIQSEGIARNLGGFSRFLDMAASQFGELVNYTAIGRECSLPTRTVQSYYEILEDTLIGFRLEPYRKSVRKRLRAHPKFYFFDTGVVNAINRTLTSAIPHFMRGRLFEHFIVLETYRKLQYNRSEARLYFWRTNHGAEVDLIIEKHGELVAAIEIKSSPNVSGADLSGLKAFGQGNPYTPTFLVTTVENAFELQSVKILPWQEYLANLGEWL